MSFGVRSGSRWAAAICAIAYSIPALAAGSSAASPATLPATTQAAHATKKPATTKAAKAPSTSPSPLAAGPKLSFNRDIRPIIGDTCLKCHGFDAKARQADLRLDTREGALADLGDGFGAIVPGHPEQSEAIRRLLTNDPDDKMPPPESGLKLTKAQIETMQRWIAQGAEYQPHWALIKPVAEPAPEVQHKAWPKSDLDRFVLAKMEKNGLAPSPEADKITLIRRVTLDLTGIPPTPAEVDAFVADLSDKAYENLVDRLLASPRYGEKMAMKWLDLARYADTNGYQEDNHRSMYRWRDWVIDAFNKNMPFDEFTIEQLAGDLLPNATIDQKIATGFNRNHRITVEGGVIPEEARTEYVIDRVETTSTTWLGLTMGCARCHDHKYDPITQKEFYQFFSFFNNVPEAGLGIPGRDRNFDPMIPAPLHADQVKLGTIEANLAVAEKALADMEPKVAAAQAAYEPTLAAEREETQLNNGLIAHYPLDGDTNDVAFSGEAGAVRGGEGPYAEGMIDQAANFNGKRSIDLDDVGAFERTQPFSISAWAYPLAANDAAIVARQNEADGVRGYTLYIQRGIVHFQLIAKFPGNALMLVSKAPIQSDVWHHLAATYDGSSKAAGAKVYLDGKPLDMNVASDNLTESIYTSVPTRIGGREASGKFLGKIDDVRLYNRPLTAEEVAMLSGPRAIARAAVKIPLAQRSPQKAAAVRTAFLEKGPAEMREAFAKVQSLKTDKKGILDSAPTVMVMAEMPKPREAHILKRGQYDQPGEKVEPGVPSCLPPMPKSAPMNRLGLAKWLVDSSNPLTARVVVNRYWQKYFGIGIVKTPENFGTQSEFPSHPELLDWLAVKFIESKWDIKAMQKLIVMSATYRQSSHVTKDLLEKDPTNKWLARGPRLRLPAESIRDEALAVSGLLVEQLGGPSVKTYQPDGLWAELATPGGIGQTFVQDHGEALYRRSLYMYWKRTVPPPAMSSFDAPSREVCTVSRSRTNTPIQALALMNDVTFVEAARKMAERIVTEGGTKPSERITHAFRLATARKPTADELKILVDDFNYQLATYFAAPEAAAKLLGIGESQKNPNMDPRELAAYTAVANVILNLDETITRE
jgi:hypothetical protein